jgi:cytochrome c
MVVCKRCTKSKLNNPSFTFTKSGIYQATLKVKDVAGNVSEASVEIKVGNDIPKVALNIKGNKSFIGMMRK